MKKLKSLLKKVHSDESGQSMMEYSMISFMILAGGTVGLPYLVNEIIKAYDIYIGSLYFILSLPFL